MDSGPLQYDSQYVTLAEQAAQSEIVTSINVDRSWVWFVGGIWISAGEGTGEGGYQPVKEPVKEDTNR